jgi:hypothetical protein
MQEAKHTAGPWHALPPFPMSTTDHGYRKVCSFTRGHGGEVVIYAEAKNMFREGMGFCWGAPAADAALVAAAPDMLAALREAEAGLEFAGADKLEEKDGFVPTPLAALRIVRAAIAAASPQ